MISADAQYVRRQLEAGYIRSPCLELGVGYGGDTVRPLIERHGIEYFGTDMVPGPAVNFVVDFEAPREVIQAAFASAPHFSSIIALNVLEHTFDPIRVLDNLIATLRGGGTLILVTPVVWPLHSFPADYWRPNPDFYVEYCRRRHLSFLAERSEYIERGPLLEYKDAEGHFRLPAAAPPSTRTFISRVVHRVFDTFGRRMFFPSHVALGAVILK
jgi:SAM-dependent methyltransferase